MMMKHQAKSSGLMYYKTIDIHEEEITRNMSSSCFFYFVVKQRDTRFLKYMFSDQMNSLTTRYVGIKAATVCVLCVACRTIAVCSHGVGDAPRTPLDVFHLVGPVPVADGMRRRHLRAFKDDVLLPSPVGRKDLTY